MKNMKKALLLLVVLPIWNLSIASEVQESETTPAQEPVKKAQENKTIFGHDEMVILPQLGNLEVHTKLDTGAKTASLSAQDLKIFTKNKEKWVRFQLEAGKKYYEFPIKRMSRIKKRSGDMESSDDQTYTERPVIELEVCLGNHQKKLEVNLTDRSRFTYQFLIGKIGLSKLKAVVDPSASKLVSPKCSTTAK